MLSRHPETFENTTLPWNLWKHGVHCGGEHIDLLFSCKWGYSYQAIFDTGLYLQIYKAKAAEKNIAQKNYSFQVVKARHGSFIESVI